MALLTCNEEGRRERRRRNRVIEEQWRQAKGQRVKGSFEDRLTVKKGRKHTRRRRKNNNKRRVKQEVRSEKQEARSRMKMVKEGERGGRVWGGISLLPCRGPSQKLEGWLRVPGEDDVPG